MADENKLLDTVIIGAGISGMTAAIYASRKRMNFVLLSTFVGGQFMISGEILNYPGIIKTTGVELSDTMHKQLKFNGVDVSLETVKNVSRDDDGNFTVTTDKNTYRSQTVIIAAGAHARKLGVPGEEHLFKRGLTYCSICDGPLYKDKTVAIVGGGDAALEAVDFMKNIASKLYLIVKNDVLQGHEYLQENVKKLENLEIIYGADTKEILGDASVSGFKYEQGGEIKQLDVDGIIVEIGRVPTTDVFKDFVKMDDHGHVLIDCQTHASVPGVFAAGDCAAGHEYQYVIAAGQGAMALIKASKYLATKKNE